MSVENQISEILNDSNKIIEESKKFCKTGSKIRNKSSKIGEELISFQDSISTIEAQEKINKKRRDLYMKTAISFYEKLNKENK